MTYYEYSPQPDHKHWSPIPTPCIPQKTWSQWDWLKWDPLSGNSALMTCIFCRIAHDTNSKFLAAGPFGVIIAAKDPVANQHVLVLPKEHVQSLADAEGSLVTALLAMATHYAKEHMPGGYRVIVNTGADAGQTIQHLHIHLLGGGKLKDL